MPEIMFNQISITIEQDRALHWYYLIVGEIYKTRAYFYFNNVLNLHEINVYLFLYKEKNYFLRNVDASYKDFLLIQILIFILVRNV